MQGKRAVVTGGTGFVGANLVRALLAKGIETHLLVRPGFRSWRIDGIREKIQIHEVQISEAAELAPVLRKIQPAFCFHLAVHGAYPNQKNWEEMVRTNVSGTMAMLQACAAVGCEAFVNTGTSSEYGYKDSAPREDAPLDPNSAYAVTKAAATHFSQLASRTVGMRVSTLRLYSAYGPFEEPTRLVPTLLVNALEGKLPPLVNPETARDFVNVSDVCDAYIAAASVITEEKGAVYNVGLGVQTTLADIVEVVCRILGVAATPDWGSMQARSWDTSSWVSDSSKILQKLGWKASTPLETGLREFADWLQSDAAILKRYNTRRV